MCHVITYGTCWSSLQLGNRSYATQKGESVRILADTASDENVVKATADACAFLGAKAAVMRFETNPAMTIDPPEPVIAAMNNADVLIEFCVNYLLYSKAYDDMIKKNRVRYIRLTGMNVASIVRTIDKVKIPLVITPSDKLVELTQAADKVHIKNAAGTDIVDYNRGRRVSQPGGIAKKPGPYMPCGQVGWNSHEETTNSVIPLMVARALYIQMYRQRIFMSK